MFRQKAAVIIAVLLLFLMAVPVTAAGDTVNTSLLLVPIVEKTSSSVPFATYFLHSNNQWGSSSASGATAPDPYDQGIALGNMTFPFWCGTNDTGAFNFSDLWANTQCRYPNSSAVTGGYFRFFLGTMPYTAGDVITIDTTIVSEFEDNFYDAIRVKLIPYWDEGVSTKQLTIYSDTDGSWDGKVTYQGKFSSLVYTPHGSTEKIETSTCDRLILAVDIYDPASNSNMSFVDGKGDHWWLQFSKTSTFTIIDPETAALQQQQQQTNDKLDDLLGQPEQEKNEASSTGNDGVGELTDVIPDYSTGFIDGMQKLASSLSYSGTKCEWTVPQLYIPAMSGVSSKKIPLTDGELKVDLGSWVQKLPSKILSVVRVLLTIALIIYCVKELYDTIQYALTLKSGGSS